MLRRNIKYFNKHFPLQDHLVALIGDKKEVKVADLGSGPLVITGSLLDGVKVEIYPSDLRDYSYFWEGVNSTPLFKVELQDMEKLTYEDNFFDIVNCVNALDHTVDAVSAIKEMLRVVKPKGWVYIDCSLYQMSTTGGRHRWDAKEDGTFTSMLNEFNLKDFGFDVKFIDNHGHRRYNHVIGIYQKKG